MCAFDVDRRKVGSTLDVAALAPPNNTRPLHPKLPRSPVVVEMGPVLDGVAEHMRDYPEEQTFVVAERRPVDVAEVLRRSGAEVVVNYLPVGSQQATEHYARACLEAGVALVNCIPVFIASDPQWAGEFERRGIPIVGDDIKSQVGATIVHRVLAQLFADRGVALDRTYQLNIGGNTDFLNMLNRARTTSKRVSKTEAVQSVLPQAAAGRRASTSARATTCRGSATTRCASCAWRDAASATRRSRSSCGSRSRTARTRPAASSTPSAAAASPATGRSAGRSSASSSYLMKHPPQQLPDDQAREHVERFLRGELDALAGRRWTAGPARPPRRPWSSASTIALALRGIARTADRAAAPATPSGPLIGPRVRAWYRGLFGPLEECAGARSACVPTHLTYAQLAVSVLAGAAFATGAIFLAGWLTILAGTLDILDGGLARRTGQASPRGAFVDSVVDRWAEFATFVGLGVLLPRQLDAGRGGARRLRVADGELRARPRRGPRARDDRRHARSGRSATCILGFGAWISGPRGAPALSRARAAEPRDAGGRGRGRSPPWRPGPPSSARATPSAALRRREPR